MTIIAALLAALAIAGVLFMLYRYISDVRRAGSSAPKDSSGCGTPCGSAARSAAQNGALASSATGSARRRFPAIHKLTRRDALAALIITLAYAVTAFAALGDRTAPQTFYRFTEETPALTIDLGDTYDLRGITYYTGSFHDRSSGDRHLGYYLELSPDGESWHDFGILTQTHAYTFHWMEREFTLEDVDEFQFVPTARYLRIYVRYFPMELGEFFVLDRDNRIIDPANYALSTDGINFAPLSAYPAAPADNQLETPTFDNPALLFDEQSLFAADQTYMNSMYFDEIYHGRTAREYLLEENVYENTHPPLGKSIISLGIMLFGMTPFGWRFMGALFGVLMVPFAYAFIKNLFGKTWLAVCGTLIFAFEFMHFTQTRIATIDTYGLFFTILMYFFMYRFLAAGYDAPARSRLIPLALCGISFGCGIASKWTCFYAAAGLVILYIIGAVTEARRLHAENRLGEFLRKFAVVVAVSFLFFVGVAGLIYYLSYLPFAAGNGKELSLATVWQNQSSMFSYHSELSASHSHQSSWWMWLLDVRPILYVFDSFSNGTVSAFSSFNTPIVSWAGLAAVAALAASLYRGASRTTKLAGAAFAAITAAAFAAQIVTYAVTYFAADAQGLDLVEDVAYTHHPFSYVFATAAVCAVITPFVAGHTRPHGSSAPGCGAPSGSAARTAAQDSALASSATGSARRCLPALLFTLATAALFAPRLISYDPASTSLVAATDTPTGYLTAALTCLAIAAPFAVLSFTGRKPQRREQRQPQGREQRLERRQLGAEHLEREPRGTLLASARQPEPHSLRSLFLLIAYLAQLLAWIPVTRNTFAYHYFPSSFFLVLAICALFDHWSDISTVPHGGVGRGKAATESGASGSRTEALTPRPARVRSRARNAASSGCGTPCGKAARSAAQADDSLHLPPAARAVGSGKRAALLFTISCLALFALFYPYLSGAPVPRDYLFTLLRWLPSWPM